MDGAIERLLSLRVGDVMSREVLTVPEHQEPQSAAELLVEHQVSAAPVVDDHGHCVGMLSATDFLHLECAQRGREASLDPQHHGLVHERDEAWHIEQPPGEVVSAYMSRAVQSIAIDASLLEAARVMDAQHVHRLPVLDTGGCPIGIVSSMDIVAALLNAVDESRVSHGTG